MSKKRILVVEDDSDAQEMVATVLEHMNFAVETADDGEQATRMLETNTSYDAIVIDLALPGKDGFQLLAEILEEPGNQSMPCVAVTAFHNSKLREEALHAGFTAYFPKPLDATQLGRELDNLT